MTRSASSPALAVTGSTGRLGRRVADRLSAAGLAQRLVVRDPDRAPSLPGAEAVRADYSDGAAARAALEGVTTLFMVSGAEEPGRVEAHRTFIDAAAAAGVTHLVYTSFFGAAPDATFTLARDHWATEEHIAASGLNATILRDNLYIDFFPLMVGDDGVLRGPAGEGRVAAVTQDDIADVAVAVLREPDKHVNARYDLTGPAALTLREVAATIAEVTGDKVSYQDESLNEAYASRAKYGAPAWQVDAWVSTYTAIAAGELDGVTTAVPTLTGHPATSLAEHLESVKRAG
ncbi:SDR family oxidoreductase [Phytohabitans houttuyneae]|uniref:NAD(P)-dependent oxidoreductase n=1 Tax=Phytohabitans houttuyneae TaxID=1076126 RepID=A0A6V8KUK9_9ACTN|nr:SDR family oxidoreductase [Phytohabitans houttuyneae]GFJ85507.1 NAD(P)-dependent oxidoreductase [Phytohabitans houttuyneae]